MVSPRGYIFIGLNAVRILSIVGLLLVFAGGIITLVHDVQAVNKFEAAKQSGNSTDAVLICDYIEGSTVPNQAAGIFWAVVNRLLIIFQVIALILAEVEWPMVFFEHYFPVLGPSFGLGALGIFQCLIGAAILSHHVDNFNLVAAFFLFSVGCLNMLLGLIFREEAKEKRSITSWRSESGETLPTHSKFASAPSFISSTYSDEKSPNNDEHVGGFRNEKAGYGFGRQGEKQAGLKGFTLARPVEALPRYAPKVSNTRTVSIRSSTSSNSSSHSRRESSSSHSSHRDSSHSNHRDSTPTSQSGPVFKSSPTAL